jgi:hypothetical protein
MQFLSLYNFKGGGTEQITGITNENLHSETDTISQNPNILFNGQFSNLSRTLVHIRLEAFKSNGQSTLHKHDIRAYESLDLRNIPLRSISVFVEPNVTAGFHGMGALTLVEDADERAVALTKCAIFETLHQSPDFDTDQYTKTSISTATTTTVMTPSTDTAIGLYKVTVSCAAAQTVELEWTDAAGTGGINVIGLLRFGADGTFVYDFDTAMLRNPNGQNGLLRAITTTTAATQIDCIGHYIHASQ